MTVFWERPEIFLAALPISPDGLERFSSPPKNRHPERSASRISPTTETLLRGVEGPRRCQGYERCFGLSDEKLKAKSNATRNHSVPGKAILRRRPKTPPMQRSRPMLQQRLLVLRRAISLMRSKPINRVIAIQLPHAVIPINLGNHRS